MNTNCCFSLSCLPSGLQSCFQAIWTFPLYKISLQNRSNFCQFPAEHFVINKRVVNMIDSLQISANKGPVLSLIDETRSVVVILAQFLLTFICWISTWSETTEEKLKKIEWKRIRTDTISGTRKSFPLSLTLSARTNLSEMRFTKTETLQFYNKKLCKNV